MKVEMYRRLACYNGGPFPVVIKIVGLGFKIQALQIKFPKLFLASNSSYLTYLFWHLGDAEYSIGLSFMAEDTGEM
jgi:hypothetical protein